MGNKLSFILYEQDSAPKYYEITKNFFRFILFGVPTISFLSLIVVILGGLYFKQIKTLIEKKEPIIINGLRQQNKKLSSDMISLEKLNKELEVKLAQVNVTTDVLPTLTLFKTTPGLLDKTSSNILTVNNIKSTVIDKNKLIINFVIQNNTEDNRKIVGYIFVVMKIGNNISIYPPKDLPSEEFQIIYSEGESFGIKRGRDVQSEFRLFAQSGKALFKILIFSRTGDLIFKHIFSKEVDI